VRFERLVLSDAGNRVAVDLHPGLSVLAGLGHVERDGVLNEFVGALGTSRSGVHLELRADDGHRFAVFRPTNGAHRVVDVDARADVTAEFTDDHGAIDLLARAGLDERSARRAVRICDEDLAGASETSRRIRALAACDQPTLWRAADEVVAATRQLEQTAEAVGSRVEDAEVIATIEDRHERFEHTQAESEQVRRVTFLTAGIAALSSVPLVRVVGDVVVLPLALIAAAAVVASFVTWRRSERARADEARALAVAGAQSYLGFHLQRVNTLLASDLGRQRLLAAAQAHRDAQRRWSELAGDVSTDWAVDRRRTVEAAAAAAAHAQTFTGGADLDTRATEALAGLLDRLVGLRTLGPGGESFPALLDEPFSSIDDAHLPTLLEALVEASQDQQVIVLTDDPRASGWARAESITGAVRVIELAPTGALEDA
jgi:ABC-type multidrug transport system fused ATPase/permease subunit